MSQDPGQLRYRGRCVECPWVGRQFVRYRLADAAARHHTNAHHHTTCVVDQYDLRIAGSMVRPGGARKA
ncbi:hypothetical protein E1262_02975 [Jiangella aurantiaca]|uniref:Uncharacterized protein n=1 Tax=Jiangella aurantiaca TaxID=2530373 RepID=A0A4R5APN8_9ACTN|nr:hypothetical protein [Jiangella aurantiaca]TDD72292.1 hypothetical protein E1262_02975 [Jiangella aurantiaca]